MEDLTAIGPSAWIAIGALALLEITLAALAIIDIVRKPGPLAGNKLVWLLVSAFVNIIGPVVYFAYGRGTLMAAAQADTAPAAPEEAVTSAVDALYGRQDPPAPPAGD